MWQRWGRGSVGGVGGGDYVTENKEERKKKDLSDTKHESEGTEAEGVG